MFIVIDSYDACSLFEGSAVLPSDAGGKPKYRSALKELDFS